MTSIKPLVYGYIRMEEPDETEIAVLRKDLGKFCSANDYWLGSIFVDRGVPDGVFARTEFTRLLDAAREAGAHGVVVPALSHLSSDAFVQDALVRMVELTGAAVFVVNKVNGDDSPPSGRQGEQGAGNAVTALVRREVPGGLLVPDPADEDDTHPQISPADRELIEQTRKANKTLSLFVLALQEGARISVEGHHDVAGMLEALTEAVRARARQEAKDGGFSGLPSDEPGVVIDGEQSGQRLRADRCG